MNQQYRSLRVLVLIITITYIVAYYSSTSGSGINKNMITSMITNICKYNNRMIKNRSIFSNLILSSYIHDYTENQRRFLFGDTSIKFRDFGVDEKLCQSLEAIGKPNATAIQYKVFEPIMGGDDIIIGAETGSGKTLSYLIPMMQKTMRLAKEVNRDKKYPITVIMAPNRELCIQIKRMAEELLSHIDDVNSLLKIDTATNIVDYWPYNENTSPDILICSPAFLGKFLKGPTILEESLFRSIQHLVLDEADMLLEGSYVNDIEKILDAFKFIRRGMIRNGEIAVHEMITQRILVAATLPSYGLRSIEKYIESKFPLAVKITNDHLHKQHPRINQEYYKVKDESATSSERIKIVLAAINGLSIEATRFDTVTKTVNDEDVENVPSETRRSTEGSSMIFVNTAATCIELAGALRDAGIECAEFHKNLTPQQKESELKLFRDEQVKVIVCTDAAARGLDIPNVRHVIQAEFALNVVQHLHRIGRASRAGALGKATNLVDERSNDLVVSILQSSEGEKETVEDSFSRRRGFRQKIKKTIRREQEQKFQ